MMLVPFNAAEARNVPQTYRYRGFNLLELNLQPANLTLKVDLLTSNVVLAPFCVCVFPQGISVERAFAYLPEDFCVNWRVESVTLRVMSNGPRTHLKSLFLWLTRVNTAKLKKLRFD